jgi:hypothetical protein
MSPSICELMLNHPSGPVARGEDYSEGGDYSDEGEDQ